MRGNYIMAPGARLVVGPHGRLEETLGALGGGLSFVSTMVGQRTPKPATIITTAPQPGGLSLAPPGMLPGVPGYTPLPQPPPNVAGSAFSGPDSTLYLVAGAVGVVGLIVYLKRRRAAQSA